VVSQESNRRFSMVSRHVLYLCLAFIGWTILGLPQFNEFWITKTKWWGLLVYILIHFGLTAIILRTTGLRLWSIALCAVGLVAVEREILFFFYAFTAWTFRGFV
jgi:hypothetical protein